MSKDGFVVKIQIKGARETLAKFNGMDKEANKELRDKAGDLAKKVAQSAKNAGIAAGAQAALVARSVRIKRDRLPIIQAGGDSPRVGRHKARPGDLLYGSEFGMDQHSGWYGKERYNEDTGFQYHPHTGTEGAWFFPTVEREAGDAATAWNAAADAIITDFGQGGA